LEAISKFKKHVKDKGGDVDEKDFNEIFNKSGQVDKKGGRKKVMDVIKDKY
jgi:hypothetical protein